MMDHAALPSLYNTRRPTPHRVERHRGQLGLFQFGVHDLPANKNPCVYGSCHQDPLPPNMMKEEIGIETK